MKQVIIIAGGIVALLVAGIGAAATAAPDRCEDAQAALSEHRGVQRGAEAAYRISVANGYDGHVAKLGPKMVAGERETERLLAAMYEACG